MRRPLRFLDHLSIGQGLTQPLHFPESRDSEIEVEDKLHRAHGLDQAPP